MQHYIKSAAAMTHSFIDAVKPALEMETLLLRAGILEAPRARDSYDFTVTSDDSQVFLALLFSAPRGQSPQVRLRAPTGETFEVSASGDLPPWISRTRQDDRGGSGPSRLHVQLRADGLQERRGIWKVELVDPRPRELIADRTLLRGLDGLPPDERRVALRRLPRPDKDQVIAESCVYTLQVLARTSLRVYLEDARLCVPLQGAAKLSVVARRGARPVLASVAVECTRPQHFVDNWLAGTRISERDLSVAVKDSAGEQLDPLDLRLRALTRAKVPRPSARERVEVRAPEAAQVSAGERPVVMVAGRAMAGRHRLALEGPTLDKPGTYNLRLVVEATASDGQVTTRELHPQLRVVVQPSRWSMEVRARLEGGMVHYRVGLRFTDAHDNVFLPRGGSKDVSVRLLGDEARATAGELTPDGAFTFDVSAPTDTRGAIELRVAVRGHEIAPEDEALGRLPSPAEVAKAEAVDACEPGTAHPVRAVDPFDDGAEVRLTREHPLDVRVPKNAGSVMIFAEGGYTDAFYLVEHLRDCKTETIGHGRGTQSFSLRAFSWREGDAVRISILDLARWIAEHGRTLPGGRVASPLTALGSLGPKREWLIVRGVTFGRAGGPTRR